MRKLIAVACLATTVALTVGTAMADSINGRLGITGRLGFIAPSDNRSDFLDNRTDAGFIGGGGLIFGIDEHVAAEFDVTRASFGSETGDFGLTDISLGAQYRFTPRRQLVPYLGVGLDILPADYSPYDGSTRSVDTTVGFHLKGGVDYFIQKRLALTGEAKILVAPDANITNELGDRTGSFDPSNFSTTFGVRYFFN
jgi:outer membrane protein